MVLLVPEQSFVTCFVFVVSTINSYCLIMLYYSFSIAAHAAVRRSNSVVVVVVFSRAQFTVQALLELSRFRYCSLSVPKWGFLYSVCVCL